MSLKTLFVEFSPIHVFLDYLLWLLWAKIAWNKWKRRNCNFSAGPWCYKNISSLCVLSLLKERHDITGWTGFIDSVCSVLGVSVKVTPVISTIAGGRFRQKKALSNAADNASVKTSAWNVIQIIHQAIYFPTMIFIACPVCSLYI